jgi:hypothetical protein
MAEPDWGEVERLSGLSSAFRSGLASAGSDE